MGFAPHTVMFLARAARAVGALTLLAWVIDCGVVYYSGRDGLIAQLGPTLVLFALPGVLMIACAKSAENGRSAAVALIFFISVLSLFKLVILVGDLTGPYFNVPLYLELPVRGLSALLSVACAYAWPDLTDMRRMRNGPVHEGERRLGVPPIATPARKENSPRRPPKRDDPPASQTPWF